MHQHGPAEPLRPLSFKATPVQILGKHRDITHLHIVSLRKSEEDGRDNTDFCALGFSFTFTFTLPKKPVWSMLWSPSTERARGPTR